MGQIMEITKQEAIQHVSDLLYEAAGTAREYGFEDLFITMLYEVKEF